MEQILIRHAKIEDIGSCHVIEAACFDPSEAATERKILKRLQDYTEGFIVAELDRRVIGFINSAATDRPDLSDEQLKDMVGHDPAGKNLVIFSLAVTPEFQGKGISRQLLEVYTRQARQKNKASIMLLCKPYLVPFYQKMGFVDCGKSASSHGGFEWHEMRMNLMEG